MNGHLIGALRIMLAGCLLHLAAPPEPCRAQDDEGFTFSLDDVEETPATPALSVEVEPNPAAVGQPQELQISVSTGDGRPISRLQLAATTGAVEGQTRTGPGRYTARLALPADTAPQVVIVAAVATIDDAPVGGWQRLVLAEAGSLLVPSRKRLDAALALPAAARAEPGGEVSLFLFALDRRGEPADRASFSVKADRGRVGAVTRVEAGVYQASYTAPAAASERPARITAWLKNSGGAKWSVDLPVTDQPLEGEGEAAIEVEMPAPVDEAPEPWAGSAEAESPQMDSGVAAEEAKEAKARQATRVERLPPARLLLGAQAGLMSNVVALHLPALVLTATAQEIDPVPGALLQLELGLAGMTGTTTLDQGPLEGRSFAHHIIAVPLTAALGYRLRFAGQFSAIAAAGGTLTYALSQVEDQGRHLLSPAVMAQAAVTWELGPGELVLSARYSYGGLEQPFGGVHLYGGYAVGLLRKEGVR